MRPAKLSTAGRAAAEVAARSSPSLEAGTDNSSSGAPVMWRQPPSPLARLLYKAKSPLHPPVSIDTQPAA